MTYYCGIDVAKRKHAVAILDERGQAHKPVFQTENTHAGMAYLVEQLGRLEDSVSIGLEATGHYWLSLYDTLTRHGYRKSGVRKVKNDRIDAVWIADFVRISNIPAASQVISLVTTLSSMVALLFGATR